jgi:hypothetical protein
MGRRFVTSKQMIARLFLGSLAAFVGSMLVAAAAVMVAVNRDVFVMNGPTRRRPLGHRGMGGADPRSADPVPTVHLRRRRFRVLSGALAATARRTDTSWFIVLLVLGLLSIGFLATLIYLVAGPPDELESAAPNSVAPSRNQPTLVADCPWARRCAVAQRSP